MKKESKNVNIRMNMRSGWWVARNNGEIIAKGYGIFSEIEFEKKWEKNDSKKIKCQYIW